MFRTSDRFTVGMTQVPALTAPYVAADELPVDELSALAERTSSTAHPALRHDRRQPSPSSAVLRASVLRLIASPCEPPTPRRAEALMLRDGGELAPAASASALSEGAGHSSSEPGGTTRFAAPADRLVPVGRKEILRAAATGLSHDESRATFRGLDSSAIGGEKFRAGVDRGRRLKKPCIAANSSVAARLRILAAAMRRSPLRGAPARHRWTRSSARDP